MGSLVDGKADSQSEELIAKADCAVCRDTLRLAMSFNCGHSLCLNCAYHCFKTSSNCVVCRAAVNYIVPNYSLWQILDYDTGQLTDEEGKQLQEIGKLVSQASKLATAASYGSAYNNNYNNADDNDEYSRMGKMTILIQNIAATLAAMALASLVVLLFMIITGFIGPS